jgi:hypothetical protein
VVDARVEKWRCKGFRKAVKGLEEAMSGQITRMQVIGTALRGAATSMQEGPKPMQGDAEGGASEAEARLNDIVADACDEIRRCKGGKMAVPWVKTLTQHGGVRCKGNGTAMQVMRRAVQGLRMAMQGV